LARPRPFVGGAFLWARDFYGPGMRRQGRTHSKACAHSRQCDGRNRESAEAFLRCLFWCGTRAISMLHCGGMRTGVVDAVLARLYQFCIGRGQVRSCICETPGGELRSTATDRCTISGASFENFDFGPRCGAFVRGDGQRRRRRSGQLQNPEA